MPRPYRRTPASCPELIISGCGKRHHADVRIDGLTAVPLDFDTECQRTGWARTILGIISGNLYAHIPSQASCYNRGVPLDLVEKRMLEGMTLSSTGKAGFADLRTGVYNNPVNSMFFLICGEINAHSFDRG